MQVQGGTEAEQRIFYTGLYHTYIQPNVFQDVDGRYLGRDGKIHQANAAAALFAGQAAAQLVGQSSHALFHDADISAAVPGVPRHADRQGGFPGGNRTQPGTHCH